MPGVVNCFRCALPGSIAWQVEENRDLVPPSQSPNAEAVGNFLVIASPDTYVKPGTAGRRDIVCTSLTDGRNYEVRLASLSKSIAYDDLVLASNSSVCTHSILCIRPFHKQTADLDCTLNFACTRSYCTLLGCARVTILL